MRVGVFIDGQNVTIGARYAFGHGNMHPLLLARALAESLGAEVELVEVRYATGIPQQEVDERRYTSQRRRHEWEWVIQDRNLDRAEDNPQEVTQARVKSKHRGQEKGVDVWLALDALVMCTRDDLDCVIVATADSDLDLLRDYVRSVPGNENTKVVQARVMRDGHTLRQNPAWDETVAIDRAIFDSCRDDFDYDQPSDGIRD